MLLLVMIKLQIVQLFQIIMNAGVQCAKDMMQRFDHARIALLEHSKALSAVDRINGFKDTVALNENYQIVGSEDCLGQTDLLYLL